MIRTSQRLPFAVGLAVALSAAGATMAFQDGALITFQAGETAIAADVNQNFTMLAERITALETQLERFAPLSGLGDNEIQALADLAPHVSVAEVVNDADGNTVTTVRFSGVDVQIVNGTGEANQRNGAGNLIVGYNQLDPINDRTGSHNLVVGDFHSYGSHNCVVFGYANLALAAYSSVTGGQNNVARGFLSSVSGGEFNQANGLSSSVSGGGFNVAQGARSSVIGGEENVANALSAAVAGGQQNLATGDYSAIAGGLSIAISGAHDFQAGGCFFCDE